MRFKLFAASAAALALLLAACGGDDTTPGTVPDVTSSPTDSTPAPTGTEAGGGETGSQTIVTIAELNGSGIAGSATLVQTAPGTVEVSVTLTGAGDGPQPIHIHPGTCDQLDPTPKHPLANVENGRSTTEVEADLDTLIDDDFAINVHKSPDEAQTYVACGNIARS